MPEERVHAVLPPPDTALASVHLAAPALHGLLPDPDATPTLQNRVCVCALPGRGRIRPGVKHDQPMCIRARSALRSALFLHSFDVMPDSLHELFALINRVIWQRRHFPEHRLPYPHAK